MIICRSTNTAKLGQIEVIRRQQAGRLGKLGKVQQHGIRTSGEASGHQGKAPTPTLPKAVMGALLWIGKYYYAGGVKKKDDWCKIIQTEMDPEVTTTHLDYAWTQIADHSTEKDAARTYR
jgi:hypothetical protein